MTKYITLTIQVRAEAFLRAVDVHVPVDVSTGVGQPATMMEINEACRVLGSALDRLMQFDFHDHNPSPGMEE